MSGGREEVVAEALAAHELRSWSCTCMGWTFQPRTTNYGGHDLLAGHRAHVAGFVLAALDAAAVRTGQADGEAGVLDGRALAAAWDAGAQAATDWIAAGSWVATMPVNPHWQALLCPSCGSAGDCLIPPCPWTAAPDTGRNGEGGEHG